MIRLALREASAADGVPSIARRRFGLDAPLPADARVVERAILRHLAEACPAIVPLLLKKPSEDSEAGPRGAPRVSLVSGIPELLFLLPGGRIAFCKVKTQAARLSRAHHAFADLCRERGIPLLVVRSLPEARAAIALLLA